MALLEKEHTWADEDCLILTQQQIEQNKKVSLRNQKSEFSQKKLKYQSTPMLFFNNTENSICIFLFLDIYSMGQFSFEESGDSDRKY